MYAKAALGAAALAGFSLIQQAPAPVWTLIPGIASIVVNGISAHMDRRDLGDGSFEVKARIDQVPDLETRQGQSCFGPVREGVPQHIVDSCCGGLAGSHVTVTGGGDRVTITGLPYDCIPLAPWVDGTGTVPYACGDDCIEYQGLSNDEYQGLKNAFESRA